MLRDVYTFDKANVEEFLPCTLFLVLADFSQSMLKLNSSFLVVVQFMRHDCYGIFPELAMKNTHICIYMGVLLSSCYITSESFFFDHSFFWRRFGRETSLILRSVIDY